jgi:thioredoxin-related protein
MKPVVDRLRASYKDRIDFQVYEQIDISDDGRGLADTHGVTAVPTMMLVAPDGTEVTRWVGGVPEDALIVAFDGATRSQ